MRPVKNTLFLEILESRALFATVGPLPDASMAITEIMDALSSSSDSHIEASFKGGNVSSLLLEGDGHGDLVIDFNKLPSFIASITLRKLDSVTFKNEPDAMSVTNSTRIDNLVVEEVNSLNAPMLDVAKYFVASQVGEIRLHSIMVPSSVFVQSDQVVKLQVDDFGDQTTLYVLANVGLIDTKSDDLTVFTRGIIVLPHVPSKLNVAQDQQLRLNSYDVSLPLTTGGDENTLTPSEEPVTLVPTELIPALLSRLSALSVASGTLDVASVNRIVAELLPAPAQSNPGSGLPLSVLSRSEIHPIAANEVQRTFEFTAPIPTERAVVATLEHGVDRPLEISHSTPVEATVTQEEELPISSSLALALENDSTPTSLHVTIDPEVMPAEAKPTLLGLISQFVDRGMDLKRYFLDQLSQEIVPGERSTVLLVDPKPMRGAGLQNTKV